MNQRSIRTVLFDLDGTLADTAPDLAYALNRVRQEKGLHDLPFDSIRPVVSHGGMALIKQGFDIETEHPEFNHLYRRLLDIYHENICRETNLFPGMGEVLDNIETRGLNWGVVTNKPAWLTEPLLDALNLIERATTIVSGDTLEQRKPHPAPMLLACEQAGSQAEQCLYIGDAERDIEAGHNAHMHTLVALFGYIGDNDSPENWGADGVINTPLDILKWIA